MAIGGLISVPDGQGSKEGGDLLRVEKNSAALIVKGRGEWNMERKGKEEKEEKEGGVLEVERQWTEAKQTPDSSQRSTGCGRLLVFVIGASLCISFNALTGSRASTARLKVLSSATNQSQTIASALQPPALPNGTALQTDLAMKSGSSQQLLANNSTNRMGLTSKAGRKPQLLATPRMGLAQEAGSEKPHLLADSPSERMGMASKADNTLQPLANNPARRTNISVDRAGASPITVASARNRVGGVRMHTAGTLSSVLNGRSREYAMRRGKCKKIHTIRPSHKIPLDPLTHVCLDTLEQKQKRLQQCFVVSIGIDNVWTFDDLMLKQGCTVYSLDPSMGQNINDRFTRHKERHKFLSKGIGVVDSAGAQQKLTAFQQTYRIPSRFPTVTLESLMKEMGTDRLDVVRMDCEGAEWPVLEAWASAGLLDKIDQLLLEIHMDRANLPQELSTMSKMLEHDNIMWSARNLYSPQVIRGTPLLPVWELGLWSKKSTYFGSFRRRL